MDLGIGASCFLCVVDDDLSAFRSGKGNGLESDDARPLLVSIGAFVCDLLNLNTRHKNVKSKFI